MSSSQENRSEFVASMDNRSTTTEITQKDEKNSRSEVIQENSMENRENIVNNANCQEPFSLNFTEIFECLYPSNESQSIGNNNLLTTETSKPENSSKSPKKVTKSRTVQSATNDDKLSNKSKSRKRSAPKAKKDDDNNNKEKQQKNENSSKKPKTTRSRKATKSSSQADKSRDLALNPRIESDSNHQETEISPGHQNCESVNFGNPDSSKRRKINSSELCNSNSHSPTISAESARISDQTNFPQFSSFRPPYPTSSFPQTVQNPRMMMNQPPMFHQPQIFNQPRNFNQPRTYNQPRIFNHPQYPGTSQFPFNSWNPNNPQNFVHNPQHPRVTDFRLNPMTNRASVSRESVTNLKPLFADDPAAFKRAQKAQRDLYIIVRPTVQPYTKEALAKALNDFVKLLREISRNTVLLRQMYQNRPLGMFSPEIQQHNWTLKKRLENIMNFLQVPMMEIAINSVMKIYTNLNGDPVLSPEEVHYICSMRYTDQPSESFQINQLVLQKMLANPYSNFAVHQENTQDVIPPIDFESITVSSQTIGADLNNDHQIYQENTQDAAQDSVIRINSKQIANPGPDNNDQIADLDIDHPIHPPVDCELLLASEVALPEVRETGGNDLPLEIQIQEEAAIEEPSELEKEQEPPQMEEKVNVEEMKLTLGKSNRKVKSLNAVIEKIVAAQKSQVEVAEETQPIFEGSSSVDQTSETVANFNSATASKIDAFAAESSTSVIQTSTTEIRTSTPIIQNSNDMPENSGVISESGQSVFNEMQVPSNTIDQTSETVASSNSATAAKIDSSAAGSSTSANQTSTTVIQNSNDTPENLGAVLESEQFVFNEMQVPSNTSEISAFTNQSEVQTMLPIPSVLPVKSTVAVPVIIPVTLTLTDSSALGFPVTNPLPVMPSVVIPPSPESMIAVSCQSETFQVISSPGPVISSVVITTNSSPLISTVVMESSPTSVTTMLTNPSLSMTTVVIESDTTAPLIPIDVVMPNPSPILEIVTIEEINCIETVTPFNVLGTSKLPVTLSDVTETNESAVTPYVSATNESSLTSLDVSGTNESSVTPSDVAGTNKSTLTPLDVSGINTSAVTPSDVPGVSKSSVKLSDVPELNELAVTPPDVPGINKSSATPHDVPGTSESLVMHFDVPGSNELAVTPSDAPGTSKTSASPPDVSSSVTLPDVPGLSELSVNPPDVPGIDKSSVTPSDVPEINTSPVTPSVNDPRINKSSVTAPRMNSSSNTAVTYTTAPRKKPLPLTSTVILRQNRLPSFKSTFFTPRSNLLKIPDVVPLKTKSSPIILRRPVISTAASSINPSPIVTSAVLPTSLTVTTINSSATTSVIPKANPDLGITIKNLLKTSPAIPQRNKSSMTPDAFSGTNSLLKPAKVFRSRYFISAPRKNPLLTSTDLPIHSPVKIVAIPRTKLVTLSAVPPKTTSTGSTIRPVISTTAPQKNPQSMFPVGLRKKQPPVTTSGFPWSKPLVTIAEPTNPSSVTPDASSRIIPLTLVKINQEWGIERSNPSDTSSTISSAMPSAATSGSDLKITKIVPGMLKRVASDPVIDSGPTITKVPAKNVAHDVTRATNSSVTDAEDLRTNSSTVDNLPTDDSDSEPKIATTSK